MIRLKNQCLKSNRENRVSKNSFPFKRTMQCILLTRFLRKQTCSSMGAKEQAYTQQKQHHDHARTCTLMCVHLYAHVCVDQGAIPCDYWEAEQLAPQGCITDTSPAEPYSQTL